MTNFYIARCRTGRNVSQRIAVKALSSNGISFLHRVWRGLRGPYGTNEDLICPPLGHRHTTAPTYTCEIIKTCHLLFLSSGTQTAPDKHIRTTRMLPLNLPLPDESKPRQDVFRFLGLPGELRHAIYQRYFGSWDATIEYDRRRGAFKIVGLPVYNIMLTNSVLYTECSHLIANSFSGKLILKDTKVLRERGFGFGYVSSLQVMASLCPSWLLENVETLTIDNGTTGMLTTLPWSRMSSLQEVHLEGSSWPVAHCYPCGLSARAQATQQKQLLEGEYDTWCMHGYNSWTQVPSAVAEGRVRVITVRQGIIMGASLKVKIEHKADHVEVRDRTIIYRTEPVKFEVEKQKAIEVKVVCCPV